MLPCISDRAACTATAACRSDRTGQFSTELHALLSPPEFNPLDNSRLSVPHSPTESRPLVLLARFSKSATESLHAPHLILSAMSIPVRNPSLCSLCRRGSFALLHSTPDIGHRTPDTAKGTFLCALQLPFAMQTPRVFPSESPRQGHIEIPRRAPLSPSCLPVLLASLEIFVSPQSISKKTSKGPNS